MLRRALLYLRTNILSRPWFRLICIVIVFPLILTIFHIWNWLSNHNCIILRQKSNESGEIHCYIPQLRTTITSSYNNNNDAIINTQYPSIALLSSSFLVLDDFEDDSHHYSTSSVTPYLQWNNVDAKWDFIPTTTDTADTIQSYYMDFTSSYNNNKRQQSQIQDSSSSSTTTTKYGFRSNPNKQIKKKPSKAIPITTIIFVIINVGLFLYYKQYSIYPESVALNSQLQGGDYGRAYSGNLAHFEIWHLGFNMMSTTSLGPILEESHSIGSLPLLLYTVSFLVLNTLMVIGLHQLRVKYCTTPNNVHNFPNMVGFSGILFTWMVVATLQDSNTQQCPIFFLPNFCFQTYKLWGKINISWSPLVQLIFLQIILPRASFLGHLSGLLIGFLWQFQLLPSVEWIQPCILFPVVWWIGKYYYESHQQQYNMDSDSSTTSSFSAAPWSRQQQQQHSSNNNSNTEVLLPLLKRLQTIFILHSLIVLLIVDSFMTSLVVSQLILTAILCIFCYQQQHNNKKNGRIMTMNTFAKGYVVLLLVIWMTDMMTLGGWFTLRILIWDWTTNYYKIVIAILLITSRIIIWWYSICVVGSIASKTTTTTTMTTTNNEDGCGGGGIWNATIWWIIEPWCFTTIGGRKLKESSCWRKLQQQMTTTIITTASTDNHHHEMIPLNEQQQQQQHREDPTVETSQLL